MKNKYFIICASAALLLGAAATSCTEGNDWDVDSSFSRLFTPTSLSVTRGDTYAVVEYGKIEGADYYQIEVSKDSLYQDEPTGTVFETTEAHPLPSGSTISMAPTVTSPHVPSRS